MNKLILFMSLMLPGLLFAAGGGVTVGDGGDSTPSQGLTVQQIEQQAHKSREVLVSFINMLDITSKDPNFNSENPAYYAKLFNQNSTLVEMLKNASMIIYPNQSCFDFSGTEKDASASQTPTPQICVSASRLQGKLTNADAFVKMGGLLAHEFSHLAGTTEDEAQDFQQRIEEELALLSLNQWEQFKFASDGAVDSLGMFYYSLPDLVAAKDWKTACGDLNVADKYLRSLLPALSSFSRYDSKQYAEMTRVLLNHNLVFEFVCKQAGTPMDEMDSAALEIIFGSEPGVYTDALDFDGLVLLGIVFNVPRPHTYVSKINNEVDLAKAVSELATQF